MRARYCALRRAGLPVKARLAPLGAGDLRHYYLAGSALCFRSFWR